MIQGLLKEVIESILNFHGVIVSMSALCGDTDLIAECDVTWLEARCSLSFVSYSAMKIFNPYFAHII